MLQNDYLIKGKIYEICGLAFLLLAVGSQVSAQPDSDWKAHYRELQREIVSYGKGSQSKTSGRANLQERVVSTHSLIWDTDRTPFDVVLRRGKALLVHLKSMPNGPDVTLWEKQIHAIESKKKSSAPGKRSAPADQVDLAAYMELREVVRAAAFSNPLLAFDDILFVERACIGKGSEQGAHQVMQYYGYTQRYGGGLYMVKNFKSANPTVVNVLENSTVKEGRMQGMKLAGGAFHAPDLSFNGKEILFSYTQPGARISHWPGYNRDLWTQDNTFHIFKVNVDGSNLVQLTDGPFNDVDPVFLPNGRVVFISERITTRGEGHMFNRCFGWYAPQSTLHSMKADGSDMYPISWFENDEYQPSVNNEGMLVYTRWDYVDRDAAIAQHLWTCYPDGRNPRAPHGNYPHPYSTMPGTGWDGVQTFPNGGFKGGYYTDKRPFAEWDIRAIPNSHKYVATAGPHHGEPYGSIITIDTRIEDDGYDSQIKRLTPYANFPEADDGVYMKPASWRYGTPWPLSEDFYFVNYLGGIYLMDKFGNCEFIVNARNRELRPIYPIPVTSRTKPRVIPTGTYQGERMTDKAPNATIGIMNAYISDLPWPEGVKLKELRIIQYIPKTGRFYRSNQIDLGYAPQSLSRVVLGTVPIEKDGSVYFEAPVKRALSFQIIDDKGMAVQLMRSITYVHPGEQMTCTGCHEKGLHAPAVTRGPIAMQRQPSKIKPDVGGIEPINFHRLVKPVLDKHCTSCHTQRKQKPDMSYPSLEPYSFYTSGGRVRAGGGMGSFTWARHGGSRSIPMKHGAYGAPLYKGGYLTSSHYNAKMTAKERRRITLWLDCNSDEIGVYENQAKQRQGELVYPSADFDTSNLLGVETRNVTDR